MGRPCLSVSGSTPRSCHDWDIQVNFNFQEAHSLEAALWRQTAQLRNRSRVLGLRLTLAAAPAVASVAARALSASQGSTLTLSCLCPAAAVHWYPGGHCIYLAAFAELTVEPPTHTGWACTVAPGKVAAAGLIVKRPDPANTFETINSQGSRDQTSCHPA